MKTLRNFFIAVLMCLTGQLSAQNYNQSESFYQSDPKMEQLVADPILSLGDEDEDEGEKEAFSNVKYLMSSNFFQLVYNYNGSQEVSFELYDVNGRIVDFRNLNSSNGEENIIVNNLQNGIYIVRLSDGISQKTKKVIVG